MEPRISIITLGVSDLKRSINFYRDCLGFNTSAKEGDKIAFFKTAGTRLALYPIDKLIEDTGENFSTQKGFSGITLAHNTRTKEEVDQVLGDVKRAGYKIIKEAQEAFWGGYSGYFSDPDGYLWEVAWADFWKFEKGGSLII